MNFVRWGMNGAAPRFRSEDDLMVKAEELTIPVAGREHHMRWYRTLAHPDAHMLAAAPELYEALNGLVDDPTCERCREAARSALAKARGEVRS